MDSGDIVAAEQRLDRLQVRQRTARAAGTARGHFVDRSRIVAAVAASSRAMALHGLHQRALAGRVGPGLCHQRRRTLDPV